MNALKSLVLAGLTLSLFIAGCASYIDPDPKVDEDASDADRSSIDGLSGPNGIPGFHVVVAPPGWEVVRNAPIDGAWTTLMRSDVCEVQTRGSLSEATVDDERNMSIQTLEQLVGEIGVVVEDTHDRTFIVEGGAQEDNPEAVLEFATVAWSASDKAGVAAARVVARTSFDGTVSSSSLELLLSCQQTDISDSLPEEVFRGIRPRVGVSELEPWGR